ncbi:hypothetical protein BGX23_000275 [Mortierella sp. AD031]|nr:hypothetical protein BGX23_000275 [Mortierella sp. AD031]
MKTAISKTVLDYRDYLMDYIVAQKYIDKLVETFFMTVRHWSLWRFVTPSDRSCWSSYS